MLLWQLSWLAALCRGVRASEARLSRQTDRGGGNLIAQPSPSLMSIELSIPVSIWLAGWLLDAAYLHAGYSSGFTASACCSRKFFLLSFILFLANKLPQGVNICE